MVKAILFDYFGTTVEWRKSIKSQLLAWARATTFSSKGAANTELVKKIDWEEFTEKWRERYYERAADALEGDKLDILDFDKINRACLQTLITEYGLEGLWDSVQEQQVNLSWHNLSAFPDVVPALKILKKNHIIAPLSNGSTRLLIDGAKYANLPWDFIFGADLIHNFKPSPSVYSNALKLLDLPAKEVMIVSTHIKDLDVAKKLGFKTAYIYRKDEDNKKVEADTYDIFITSFEDLCDSVDSD